MKREASFVLAVLATLRSSQIDLHNSSSRVSITMRSSTYKEINVD